jgi:hypothetical protein
LFYCFFFILLIAFFFIMFCPLCVFLLEFKHGKLDKKYNCIKCHFKNMIIFYINIKKYIFLNIYVSY